MSKYDNRAIQIGARIRKERTDFCKRTIHPDTNKKYTQKDFCEKIYLSRESTQTLKAWENGVRLPDLDSLVRMAEVFECDVGYLLCDYDDRKWVNADIQKQTRLSLEAVDKWTSLLKNNPHTEFSDGLSQFFVDSELNCRFGHFSLCMTRVNRFAWLAFRYERLSAEFLERVQSEGYDDLAMECREALRELNGEVDLLMYNISSDFNAALQDIIRNVSSFRDEFFGGK